MRSVIKFLLITTILFVGLFLFGFSKAILQAGLILQFIIMAATIAAVRAVWKYNPQDDTNYPKLDK